MENLDTIQSLPEAHATAIVRTSAESALKAEHAKLGSRSISTELFLEGADQAPEIFSEVEPEIRYGPFIAASFYRVTSFIPVIRCVSSGRRKTLGDPQSSLL